MVDTDAAARARIVESLRITREELRQILDPPPEIDQQGNPLPSNGQFPRSHTMRALLSSRGVGTVGALAGGLLLARPKLALRMLRLIPAGTVAKIVLARAMSAIKGQAQK